MKVNKISFITPIKELYEKTIVLEKKYSQKFKLSNGTELSLCSDQGKRKNQEDCIAIAEKNEYLLLLVADGMGGMSHGEIASYTTAKIIKKWLDSEDKNSLKLLDAKNLEDVLNALMYIISINIPINSGSTLNMSIIGPNETLIANVGDSRTYIIKDGKLSLVTKDDSVVFKKYNPQTTEEREKLRFHKKNNIITNAINKNAFSNIKITTLNNNDYDVLCHLTDGVSDFLSESLIQTYIQGDNPASLLVNNSTKGIPINSDYIDDEFRNQIYPGEDNATAIVYTKKKTRITN